MAPKYKSLSIKEKVEILKEVNSGRKKCDIAKEYNIPKSTLSTLIKHKNKILAANTDVGPERKRMRLAAFPDLEEALILWVKKMREKNVPIDGNLLKAQAEVYGLRMGIEEDQMKFSDGWLQRLKNRHGLTFRKVCGESGAVNLKDVKEWQESRLKRLLNDYAPKDIFNADETGLFYKLLPNRTFSFKGETCSGGKQSKLRITVMLCANMDGSEKLTPFVIGKAQKPRCFKGVRNLPVRYRANTKSWMTAKFFEEWLVELDRQYERAGRNILLVVDNCTAHVELPSLKAIRLEFLPPNVTSVLQPLDQGIIQSYKKHYRGILLRRLVLNYENDKEYAIDVLGAIHLTALAWEKVSQSTIANCFRHAGFVQRQSSTEAAELAEVNNNDVTEENEQPADRAGADAEGLEGDALLADLRERDFQIPEEVTFDSYVNIDNEVQCSEEISDDEIIERVTSRQAEEMEQEVPIAKPTRKETCDAAEVMLRFFQCEDGAEDSVRMLLDLQNRVLNSRVNLKQCSITSFLQM